MNEKNILALIHKNILTLIQKRKDACTFRHEGKYTLVNERRIMYFQSSRKRTVFTEEVNFAIGHDSSEGYKSNICDVYLGQ